MVRGDFLDSILFFSVPLIFYFIGQSSAVTLAALPSHAGSSASPDLTGDPGNEVPKQTHNPAGRDETSTQTTTVTKTEGTVHPETVTNAVHKTHLFTASLAVVTSQRTDVPAVMSADPGTLSASGNPDKPACTIYIYISKFRPLLKLRIIEIMVIISSIIL